MAELATLVAQLQAIGDINALAEDRLAQFGPNQQFLGATILPEREVRTNIYEEASMTFYSIIANDGDRYSPAQLKAAKQMVGSMLVHLGDQDIARQFTGYDYDAALDYLNRNMDMRAADMLLRWTDRAIVEALTAKVELQRWQAIVNGAVTRVGDNGYAETVSYPNPAGHRAAAGGTWSNNAYDPMTDVFTMANLLANAGYPVIRRAIASTRVVNILTNNQNVAERSGNVRIYPDGTTYIGRASRDALDNEMRANRMPAIEVYDATYEDQAGRGRFLPDTVMVLIADTGVDPVEPVAGADFTPDDGPLGYTAIGRAVGQTNPGRVVQVEAKTDKPPRVEGQGWQSTLPVITRPTALAVITGIG